MSDRTLEEEMDYMIEMWTTRVLPSLVQSTRLRQEDHRIATLTRDAQVLYVECDACQMSRDRYNEGRFDEGVFCRGACPLSAGCGPVWFETVAHLEALNRSKAGQEMKAPNCEKFCSAHAECDGTLQFCIDHLAANVAGVQETWVDIAAGIKAKIT